MKTIAFSLGKPGNPKRRLSNLNLLQGKRRAFTPYSMALPMSSITFLASPNTIMVLSM